jgi:anaerobic magnesium-protoporphyrin IX monomethyl ester cyclase
MKVTFVCPGDEMLGIGYMSAVLKQHDHRTDLVFDPRLLQDSLLSRTFLVRYLTLDADQMVSRILETEPDLVAFTATTNTIQWAFGIAQRLKQKAPEVPTIFGGPHVTAVPERVIVKEFVDYVCVGPGEYALLKLVEALGDGDEAHHIKGIWSKRGGQVMAGEGIDRIDDLDQLPFPDKELFYDQLPFYKDPYIIVSSRGCPYSCSYCLQSMYTHLYRQCGAKPYQRRSVDNVIEELVQAKARWGMRSVKFFDDLFAFHKGWLREFCEKYRDRIGLPFRCSLHPAVVDEEILEMLRSAGAYTLTVGVESANPQMLREILNRKGSYEKMKRSLRLMKDARIYFSVDHIFGLPGEADRDHRLAAELYNQIRPDNILLYWLVYYPKTDIIKHGLEAGLITPQDVALIEEGRGHISYKHAQGKLYRKAYPYYILFHLLPLKFIPRFVVDWMIRKNLIRLFRWPLFTVVVKQFFDSLDPRSSRNEQLRKTMHLYRYVFRQRRAGRPGQGREDDGGRRRRTWTARR